MRDRIERFVLLPFSMGCISESSIAVGAQFPNRSKRNANSTPTSLSLFLSRALTQDIHSKHSKSYTKMYVYLYNSVKMLTLFVNSCCLGIPEDDKEEEEEYEDDQESLSDENLKSPLSLLAGPKFQRLFKNFKNLSQLFVYKDDDEMEEDDTGMEIGFPTDVKHVTHIGIDGSATSILSKGWDNLREPDRFNPRSSVRFTQPKPTKAEKLNLKGPSETAYV